MTEQWWEKLGDYILGLDLGPSSLGWAIIELIEKDGEKKPGRIVKTGVRRFEAGVLGDIESGRDESRATARRDARGPRRNTWRRQWRMRKLFRKLQHFGLLPASEDDSPDARHELLQTLDAQLREEVVVEENRVDGHLLPYRLRAMALDGTLPPHAVGRAIYHLGQRRGFLSNRKAAQDDEDTGVVKKGISELHHAMDEAGARTLGEYFATLDPEEARIRARWTGRKMFADEFEQIWASQSPHHDAMTDEAKAQISAAIFDQRPLKSQKGLIGRCDLEKEKRRAPLACLLAQRFRIWQRLNDLRVTAPDGEVRALDMDEKKKLFAELDVKDRLTWHQVKAKVLGMKKSKEYGRDWVFNFEDGHKDLIGNRTAAKMIKAIGDCWTELPPDRQAALVDEMISFESEEALARRLERGWGFSPVQAKAAADTVFEKDNASHSRAAMARLLLRMEQGEPYSTARKECYGEAFVATSALDQLPPVKQTSKDGVAAFPTLRNPAVERAMSELRKVVNAIVSRCGKPTTIRVELARELKHARNRREEMSKRRDENTKIRDRAAKRILDEIGERYVTRDNILKVRLAEECNWVCPFTGKSISMKALVGDQPQFDIEHIIPFSRCLDNSYLNKTLCQHEENRNVKGNKTPWEAYHGTEQYEQILQRVRRFRGDARSRKLTLFETEVLPDAEEFTQKQLSDTRYLSKLATQFLGLLYGGKIDEGRKMRVQVLPGRATSYLRQRWNLNSIIGHADQKNRADHRHHAIDAVVVALTTPRAVQMLCEAAEEAEERGDSKLFADVELPWEEFLDEARASIHAINVSSRVSKKLNGSLHKETILSKPHKEADKSGKEVDVHYVRKPLAAMSAGEVDAIVDHRVRELVQQKLHAHGGSPAQVFKDPANYPHLTAKKDPRRIIPIRRARIRKPDHPMPVGNGTDRRYVNPGSNHHIEIVAVLDKEGKEKKWEGVLVSQFEAVQRHRRGEDVIQRDHGAGRVFKFSLAGGEHLMLDNENELQIVRAVVITEGQVESVYHSDARPITIRKKHKGARIRCSPDGLRKKHARKVVVSPLGDIGAAND